MDPYSPESLEAAYHHCETMARNHYENFPVASRLLPRDIRRPIAVIYAFARTADDFADEGDHSVERRLELLGDYAVKLEAIERGMAVADPVFIALADVQRRFSLPFFLFHDLLSAFSQDVTQRRYDDFAQLLDYCRRSANPVGRLLLHLTGNDSEENLLDSDRICSALQLINFYQDLAQDFDENDRIYLPLDEMAHFGVDEGAFRERSHSEAMQRLMGYQFQRTRQMMERGSRLGTRLTGRFGFEIRLITEGGLAVLSRLEAGVATPFARPRLRRRDWLQALLLAI